MAQTTSADVFIPEVYEDTAQAAFLGAVKFAASGAVLEANTLEGNAGESVTFPKWDAMTELADLAEGTPLVPEAMGSSSSSATIKEVGKAVEITDKAKLTGLGDPEAEAARQFGILQARKVDADLIAAAQADETAAGGGLPLTSAGVATHTKLDWTNIVAAIGEFGDEWAPEDFAGIFVNSAQHIQLLEDANFISADKLGQAGTPIAKGQVGAAGGVAIFVTDRVAAGKVLLVKRNAMGLLYKRRPLTESDRDVLARSTVIATTAHYAVKRLSDRGVCVLTIPVA